MENKRNIVLRSEEEYEEAKQEILALRYLSEREMTARHDEVIEALGKLAYSFRTMASLSLSFLLWKKEEGIWDIVRTLEAQVLDPHDEELMSILSEQVLLDPDSGDEYGALFGFFKMIERELSDFYQEIFERTTACIDGVWINTSLGLRFVRGQWVDVTGNAVTSLKISWSKDKSKEALAITLPVPQ